VLADRKAARRRVQRYYDEISDWDDKARLAVNKGREDLAKAALYEKRLLSEEAAAVEAELLALDEHVEQLHDEIGQLQQKLGDAKARQKAMEMRGQTVESRIKVKRQIQRDTLDDAFAKFERYERRMDNLEGQLETMDVGHEVKSDLASEIESLAEDEKLNEELARLKADMTAGNSE
jgi:phage shock protein A